MKESILFWMQKLASVPRQSHHEEQVSAMLKGEIESMGFSVQTDAVGNILAEIPATSGKENSPSVILQAHMDMVIAVREGKIFDPLKDVPILYEDDGILSSRGETSIGADDGIGIALALAFVASGSPHGPLKLLFTVDEEDGMTGATNTDPSWLDSDYLINLDWESFGSVCNSCAGCRGYTIESRPSYEETEDTRTTIEISASGFRGGHSGITIAEGRDNAILVLGQILKAVKEINSDIRLVAFSGGSARNAIPSHACVKISVPQADAASVCTHIDQVKHDAYAEENAEIAVFVLNERVPAASPDATTALIDLITKVPNGVYSMSAVIEGLVECSSNLGLVACDQNGFMVDIFARSSSYEKEEELENLIHATAEGFGFSVTLNQSAPGWPVNPESKLLPALLAAYEDLFQKPMIVEPVHAGLECGWFVIKNKSIDCVSFGPTLHEVHTPNEALDINSATDTYALLVKLLATI